MVYSISEKIELMIGAAIAPIKERNPLLCLFLLTFFLRATYLFYSSFRFLHYLITYLD